MGLLQVREDNDCLREMLEILSCQENCNHNNWSIKDKNGKLKLRWPTKPNLQNAFRPKRCWWLWTVLSISICVGLFLFLFFIIVGPDWIAQIHTTPFPPKNDEFKFIICPHIIYNRSKMLLHAYSLVESSMTTSLLSWHLSTCCF